LQVVFYSWMKLDAAALTEMGGDNVDCRVFLVAYSKFYTPQYRRRRQCQVKSLLLLRLSEKVHCVYIDCLKTANQKSKKSDLQRTTTFSIGDVQVNV